MIARVVAFALTVSLLASCEAPASVSPAPSASATAGPSSTLAASTTAATSGEIRVPLEAGTAPVTADAEALIVTRRLIDGRTTRVEAIELRTGSVTAVRETVDAQVGVGSLRDGVLTLTETEETGVPMEYRIRVYAGRWRSPASFVKLDEVTLQLGGGDSWNPYPDPQTNGWEIAWLHADAGVYELRLREADGATRTAYSSRVPFFFALMRSGDVAIGDLGQATQTAPVALRLYSGGAVRTLLERPVSGAGRVIAQSGGRIVWTNGTGMVARIASAERIVIATLARETLSPPSGCFGFGGATETQVAFACDDHVEFEGAPLQRAGPPFPLLRPRAVIRTDAGPPLLAFVTPVTPDEPRPGAGARF